MFFEIAAAEGLEQIASQELHHRFKDQTHLFFAPDRFRGVVQFAYGGGPHNLLSLKTVLSLFWVMRFPVPRPKALLGHQNLLALLNQVDEVRKMWPKGAFKTLHLAASGTESAVMQRIAEEIANHAGLTVTREDGDLLVRIRRPLDGSPGWETAIRMAPRPLSVRSWRVCDWKGALNASVAQAIIQLTRPRSEDIFLNIGCGSGTLLVERSTTSPARQLIGCDIDPQALECARQNILASKQGGRVRLTPWDARSLPLADQSIDVICCDLPFGHDVGSHRENLELYPLLLKEAARVGRDPVRCVLFTHEIRLMNGLLETSPDWEIDQVIQLTIAGLHPNIYILKKRNPR